MSLKATVTARGAVLLGKYVACDAFDEVRPLRVVTHAHSDHMLGLRQSLENCEAAVMTPATKDLISVLKGPLFLTAGKVKTLGYDEDFTYEDERLTLHHADHILGAAQVLIEDAEGTRILYTSDFRLPETPIIESDILVMETTYGNPSRVRPFKKTVKSILVSLVKQGFKKGPVYLFGYYGKIQEVMQILHGAGVRAPFVVPEKVFGVSKICERHGMRLGGYLLSSGEEAQLIMQRGQPYIAFYHMGSRRYVGKDALRICMTGWEFEGPYRRTAENEYVIALSDHSDFKGLIQYVKESKPKLVITDNYRAGDAVALAREIQKQLNIPARPLPTKRIS
ncbi:MAG: MBL fold metallo-hydrolase [Candidatus Bathyarchaeota archaeon]|nr:MBL fold metallo-hydrolase [Candidatus Bathyarchaeota archaeon]MDH5712317.1 MBL fold metallo-hydrolase [Candidatus Bathyarchaeota archaeon]